MPPVAVAAAVAVASVATAEAITVAVVLSALAQFAIGVIAYVLTPTPPKPNSLSDKTRLGLQKSPTAVRRIVYGRVATGGAIVFMGSLGTDDQYLYMVVAWCQGEIDGYDAYVVNGTVIPFSDIDALGQPASGKYSGYLQIASYYGTSTQEADVGLVNANLGWTVNHRMRGVAYTVFRLKYNSNVYGGALPNILAVVRGRKVYDPRTGHTAWSNNAALVIRDYLTSSDGLGATAAEIDDDTVIAAANICDEVLALPPPGGTQTRYVIDGSVDLSSRPIDVIEQFTANMMGAAIYSQGQYKVYAGAYTTPTVTLTADDLRDKIKVRAVPSRKDVYNGVKGTYLNRDTWQPTDFAPVTDATYLAQDGGERRWKSVEFPFVTDETRAQRLAKLLLRKGRLGIIVEFPAKLTALRLAPWDTVYLNIAQLGWVNKVFRVQEWKLSADGGIDLVLGEEDPNAYTWTFSDASYLPAPPRTNLPAPGAPSPPGTPSIQETLYRTRYGSGLKSRATVSWAPSPDAGIRAYQLEWRAVNVASATVWDDGSSTWDGGATVWDGVTTAWNTVGLTQRYTQDIDDLAPGTYDFRVKALGRNFRESAYSYLSGWEILGLAAPPSPPQHMRLQIVSSTVALLFDEALDLDVQEGGRLRVRWSPLTSGATWSNAIDIPVQVPGTATFALLPLLAGTFLAKWVDSSGIESLTASSVSTNAPTLSSFTPISTVTESPTFPGTKTNVAVSSGALELTGAALWDDASDLDAVSDIDAYGGVNASGTYLFATGIDQGSIQACRLRVNIAAESFSNTSNVDARPTAIDDWSDFDQTEDSSANVVPYFRYTDSDPAGSPSWSDWEVFHVTETKHRAFEFKIEFSNPDPAQNYKVTDLSVTAEH